MFENFSVESNSLLRFRIISLYPTLLITSELEVQEGTSSKTQFCCKRKTLHLVPQFF